MYSKDIGLLGVILWLEDELDEEGDFPECVALFPTVIGFATIGRFFPRVL